MKFNKIIKFIKIHNLNNNPVARYFTTLLKYKNFCDFALFFC